MAITIKKLALKLIIAWLSKTYKLLGLFIACYSTQGICDTKQVNAAPTITQLQIVRTLEVTDIQNSSIGYFAAVLKAALEASKSQYGPYELRHEPISHSQARAFTLLNQAGSLDVLHSVSNQQREKDFIAIKFPLINGLMGKRLILINKQDKAEFDQLTLAQLKQKTACQGRDWPDSDILEANGFTVSRVLIFEAMFDMLAKSRCDYFPRGIHEIFPEFKFVSKQYPNLMIYPNLLLEYPNPLYFFVGKHNQSLAKRLEFGLDVMTKNGQLQKMLQQADFIQALMPLSQWDKVRTFTLANPSFPATEDTKKAN